MSKIIKIYIALLTMFTAGQAMAQSCGKASTVAAVADCVTGQLDGVLLLLSGIVWIGGFVLAYKGVLLLKEVNEKKGQMSIAAPICMVLAGALLIAMPTAINFGLNTLGLTGFTTGTDAKEGTTKQLNY